MIHIDKLAARSHHRHSRPPSNFQLRISKRCQRRDHRRTYLFARAQNSLAHFDFASLFDNRSAPLDRFKNFNEARAINFARQFNLLHRIGPGRHGRAGHNAHRFARFHLLVPPTTRRRFTNNPQTHRRVGNVRGPNRVPIHLRAIEWRQISVSNDIFGENSPKCIDECDRFGRQTGCLIEDNLKRFGNRNHCPAILGLEIGK